MIRGVLASSISIESTSSIIAKNKGQIDFASFEVTILSLK
jgi:hypothetical protein